MRTIRDLMCWLFGHRCPPGVTKAESIVFMCTRCNCAALGDMSARRRA